MDNVAYMPYDNSITATESVSSNSSSSVYDSKTTLVTDMDNAKYDAKSEIDYLQPKCAVVKRYTFRK